MFIVRYGRWIRSSIQVVFVVMLISLGSAVSFASSDGGHESKGWVATDSYRVFNFAILAVGLFLVIRKPASEALGGRIQGIKKRLEDLEAQKLRVEAELIKHEDRLAKLDEESKKVLSEYIKQGEEAKSRILAEAEFAAERLKKQSQESIEREFALAKIELQREVVDKALIKAEGIIKSQIGSDDQEDLIDKYLEKVVA